VTSDIKKKVNVVLKCDISFLYLMFEIINHFLRCQKSLFLEKNGLKPNLQHFIKGKYKNRGILTFYYICRGILAIYLSILKVKNLVPRLLDKKNEEDFDTNYIYI
jgi:predicted nucleotidyltransferase